MTSGRVFFSADHHFGHARIIDYCARPFHDAHEMNLHLVEQWNKTVRPTDTVYYLGDLAMRQPSIPDWLYRLNGTVHYVLGNHDKKVSKLFSARDLPSVAGIHSILEVSLGGCLYTLCHYCLLTWNKSHWNQGMADRVVGRGSLRGASIQLFAHSHGTLQPPTPFQLDVGIDSAARLVGEYRPLALEEVEQLVLKQVEREYKGEEDRVQESHPVPGGTDGPGSEDVQS